MTNTRSIDTMLKGIEEYIASKKSLSGEQWLDIALTLLSLQDPENQRLIELEQAFEKKKDEFLSQDMPVNRATTKAKLTEEYKAFKLQDLKMKKVTEMVKAAKKYADINEYR